MEQQKKSITESIIEGVRNARGGLGVVTDVIDAVISGDKARKKIENASEKAGIEAIKGYRKSIGDIDEALKEIESATKKMEKLMEDKNDKKGKNPKSHTHHGLPEEENPQVRKQNVKTRAFQVQDQPTEEVVKHEAVAKTEARQNTQNLQDIKIRMIDDLLKGKYSKDELWMYVYRLENPSEGASYVPDDVLDAYKKVEQELARREREEKRIRELVQSMNKHLEEGKYSEEELRRYIRLLESNQNDAVVPKDIAYAYAKAREERSRGFWGIFRRSEERQLHYADKTPNTTNDEVKKETAQKPEEKKPVEVAEKKVGSNMENLTKLFSGVVGDIAMTAMGGPLGTLTWRMISQAVQQTAQQQQTTQERPEQEKTEQKVVEQKSTQTATQQVTAQQTTQEKPKQEKTEQKAVEPVQKSATVNNVQKPSNTQKPTTTAASSKSTTTSQTSQKASRPASQAGIEGLRREINDLKKRVESIEKQLSALREYKNGVIQNELRNGKLYNSGNNNNGDNNKNNANNKSVSQKNVNDLPFEVSPYYMM